MSIYSKKHLRFRNAVVTSMRDIAEMSVIYDDAKKRSQYIEDSVDTAFNTILICFDDELYSTLTDTVCRRCAKSEIHHAVRDLIELRLDAKNNNQRFDDATFLQENISADSVFEDIEEMCDDE